jgi:hypothetical protein
VLFVWCSIGIIQLLYLVTKKQMLYTTNANASACCCLELVHNLCMVNFAELCARGLVPQFGDDQIAVAHCSILFLFGSNCLNIN